MRRAKIAEEIEELRDYLTDVSYEINEIVDKGED
ncbi:hypothetical protein HRbin06_00273 [archaeon HR06]|nr:hypothetical protein HRbin06_00273 [archaeon HR06]